MGTQIQLHDVVLNVEGRPTEGRPYGVNGHTINT